jgi:hypothetical protein
VRAEQIVRRAERWIFAREDARRLATIRIGLCSVLALRLALTDYGSLANHPVRFHPHFYMDVFGRMPSHAIATALQVSGIVAALVAAAGLAVRASLPIAFGCSLVLNGMVNSGGRIIVGNAALMLCLLVLVACGRAAGEAWVLGGCARRAAPIGERYGWPIRTAMITVALAYFFAGFQKWRYSGLSWVTSDNLRWILYGQAHPNGLSLAVADRPLLAHVLAAGALLLETCFPLVLLVPRLRWVFIPAAVAMHIGIRLTLGLDYSTQWLATLVVFVNWPVVLDRLRRELAAFPTPRLAAR